MSQYVRAGDLVAPEVSGRCKQCGMKARDGRDYCSRTCQRTRERKRKAKRAAQREREMEYA